MKICIVYTYQKVENAGNLLIHVFFNTKLQFIPLKFGVILILPFKVSNFGFVSYDIWI